MLTLPAPGSLELEQMLNRKTQRLKKALGLLV